MKITGIKRDKHVKGRFYVRFEGGESFPVSAETIAKYNLAHGSDIGPSGLEAMLKEDEKKRAIDASFSLLSFSQRSRKELAERLKLKSFSAPAIDHAIERLIELGYLNDPAFAKNLLLLRRSQGKGNELIKFELKRKGIPADVISSAFAENPLSTVEEAKSILPLARKKLSLARGTDKEAAVRRLTGFLARRGFSLDTVRTVLNLLKKGNEEAD